MARCKFRLDNFTYLSIHQLKIHCKGLMNDELLVQSQTKPHFNGIIKGSFSTDPNGKVQVSDCWTRLRNGESSDLVG